MAVLNKTRKILLFIFAGIVLLYLIIIFTFDIFLENLVKKRLNSYINSSPQRLYDIHYDQLDISVHDRAVGIGHLYILPRKNAIDSMRRNHLSMLVSAKVDSFHLDGLHLFKLLMLNRVEIEEIVAERPEIKYYFNKDAKVPPEKGEITTNVLTDKLKHALIHHFKIDNGRYYVIRIPVRDSIYFSLDSSTLLANNIVLELENENPFRKVYFDSLLLVSRDFYGGFIKDYKMEAGLVEISTKRGILKLDSLLFYPKHFSMADTSVQFSHDVFMVKANGILFTGLNYKGDYQHTDFFIRNVIIDRPDFTVSTDKRLPRNMNRKPLPAELIRNIPVNLVVDSLQIKNGKVLYHEVTNGQKPPLDVFFAKVHLLGRNITNNPQILKQNPEMTVSLQSKFLNAGILKVDVRVPVLSSDNKMFVEGALGPMSFQPVSKMLEGPMGVRFTSGKINSLDFHFVADTSHSTGKLNFDYSDMKIQIFKAVDTTKVNKKEKNKWFLNAIVNGVVKTNNHKEDINFASGLIEYQRPSDIAIPGYLYRSLKAGLLSTFKPGKRHGDEAMARKKAQTTAKKEVKKKEKASAAAEKSSEKGEKREKKKKKGQKPSGKVKQQKN